jgi:hypothetical protein
MRDEKQEGGRYGYWLAIALALTPVLYTLSVGPAAYLIAKTEWGLEVGRMFYAPLIWLGGVNPEQWRLLGNYEHYWRELAQ